MPNNITDSEENCKICDSFHHFKYMVREDVSIEEAFHSAFTSLADKLVDDVIDVVANEAYSDGVSKGFDEGYESGIRASAEHLNFIADSVEKECTCDENEGCTDCPTTPSDSLKCGDCECEEECEIDVEIRRAMWEDI